MLSAKSKKGLWPFIKLMQCSQTAEVKVKALTYTISKDQHNLPEYTCSHRFTEEKIALLCNRKVCHMIMTTYFTMQYLGKFVHMENVILVYIKAEELLLISLFQDLIVLVRTQIWTTFKPISPQYLLYSIKIMSSSVNEKKKKQVM